jgi:hypothetical protein
MDILQKNKNELKNIDNDLQRSWATGQQITENYVPYQQNQIILRQTLGSRAGAEASCLATSVDLTREEKVKC